MNDFKKHKGHFAITLMTLPRLLLCLTFFFPLLVNGKDVTATKMVMSLVNAAENGNKIPVLSKTYTRLNLITAYQVQKSFISLQLAAPKKEKIAGFKAGLTSLKAMKRFGLDQPVAGVLPASGKISHLPAITPPNPNAVIMMECEIGFIAEHTIDSPVKDTRTLKTFFLRAAPVIELPNLGYTDMKSLTGPDIVASNVGAARFIIGVEHPVENFNPDSVTVTLSYNGKTVNNGKGADTMGGQWKALLWLVNHTVKQGWTIQPGHLLITGAMGKMIPARAGKYKADYREFGVIEFNLN